MTMSAQHTTVGWAIAWTRALETAAVDKHLLRRGRSLLQDGTLSQFHVNTGCALAKVPAPGGALLHATLTVPVLSPVQWSQIDDAIVARPDLARIVLTRGLTDVLAEPSATGGVPIIPAPGELAFSCTCRPSPGLCEHTAALGYTLADRAKTAPGILLTLRGRSHKHLKNRLRTTTPATAPAPEATPLQEAPAVTCLAGPTADEAFARWTASPARAGTTGNLLKGAPAHDALSDAPPCPALDVSRLRLLIEDAAQRATAQLGAANTIPAGPVDELTDTARLLATTAGAEHLEAAAHHLGLSPRQLRHMITAYQLSGAPGVHVTAHHTPTDPGILADAEAAIQPLRPAPLAGLERDHNRLTDRAARVQLRFGPDYHWHPYTEHFGDWRPVAGHAANPAHAYKAARRDLRRR
ncbi:hypothetical protein [Streptomyces rhizosphaericus]|uniref:hypothetical protein n=1 Tax=Streptomyces rhizosphaericus TaxID=114699 RepID=UPI00117FAD42|nr:hypothetical protein [Streptomyces rhizosphaericus]